jgi:hypothetical protein
LLSKRSIDLHILVQTKSEQVRHALAHLHHLERRAGPRLDNLDERRIAQLSAVGLQPHLDDGFADVISDGGLGRAGENDEKE